MDMLEKSKNFLNKHIRFDEYDSDSEREEDEKLETNVVSDTEMVIESEYEKINFNLVKNRKKKEKTFGFHLAGDSSKAGDHHIDSIDSNSAADRSGLKQNDKIIKVNGIKSDQLNINSLIDLIAYETSLNDFKLNLDILRKKTKRALSVEETDAEIDDQKLKKYKKVDQVEVIIETGSKASEQNRFEKIHQIKFFSPQRVLKLSSVPSKTVLNSKAKEIQMNLSQKGKYVSWQEVLYELINSFDGCETIGDLGLNQADNLEVISELIRLQKRIDILIITAHAKVPLISIMDLEQSIINDYNHNLIKFNPNSAHLKITSFEEIYLGPLIKNQIIRQVFNIPDDIVSSKQLKLIRGSDLMKSLVTYLQENDLWNSKVKQTELESYLIQKYKIDSFFKLGVKIINLGVLIGCLKSVQYNYSECLKETKQNLVSEFRVVFKTEKELLFKKLNDRLSQLNEENQEVSQIRSSLDYLNSDSIEIIADLLKLFENLLEKPDYYYINDFLTCLKESSYLRDCFQLAICLGKHDLQLCLRDIEENLNNEENNNYFKYQNLLKNLFFLICDTKIKSNRDLKRFFNRFLKEKNLKIVASEHKRFDDNVDEDIIDYDKEDDVFEIEAEKVDFDEKFKNFVKSKIEPNSFLNLDHLIKIENSIFQNSAQNFMTILNNNKYFLDEAGIKIDLFPQIESNLDNKNNEDFKKSFLIEHLKQIKTKLEKKLEDSSKVLDQIEKIVCSFYSVKSVTELGYGDLDTLLDQSSNLKDTGFYYLEPFQLNRTNSIEELIEKIEKCPLLDNLYDYLDWSNGLSIEYGDLKQFLNDLNSKNRIFYFLQTGPYSNQIYKLTNSTSIELLKESIENLDSVLSSGYLASLIYIKYKCLEQTPKSLLINEIQTSFSKIFKHVKDIDKIYGFIIEFIYRLPLGLLNEILFSFILAPLIKINSNNQIKNDLFEFLVSRSFSLDHKMNFFINLGNLFSIQEWSLINYKKILNNKNNCNEVIQEVKIVKIESKTEETISKIIPEQIEIENSECILDSESCGPFEHIEEIRKRYGIGIDLNQQSKTVTESLKGVIGRSLESLSHELYNKDMHFVLELIQNADDNLYPKDIELDPTLIFLIEKDLLCLFNNELGFTAKNINAICDVKASTKGKHQKGYIGRKGIGFKSVFTVTNQPEIHSNKYHIKFDLSNGHIGYILPNWINNDKEIENKKNLILKNFESDLKLGYLRTCIKLPLKTKFDLKNFQDVKPDLLLFLNRLRNLIIIYEEKFFVYKRIDIDKNLVEIQSNLDSNQKWFVVRKNLIIPDNLKPCEQIESTELCLAFPLEQIDFKKMDIFAYLPLRSFGFKFIVQADFVVPASRQDLNQDNAWNQWLVRQIPNLFLKSLKKFLKKYNDLNYLKYFLKFIPLENEIIGIFQHIPSEIFSLLKTEEFIPVIDETEAIVWKSPIECVLIEDEFIREMLSPDLLRKYDGRFYVHPCLLQEKKLLEQIGIQVLSTNDLIEILKCVFSSDLTNLETISKWFVLLQHCLNNSHSLQQQDKFINQIKKLEIIPIKRFDYKNLQFIYEMVSFDKNRIFYEENLKLNKTIKNDLCLLDREKLLCLDELKNSQVIQLLKTLGLKSFAPSDIIEFHIQSVFSNQDLISSKPEHVLEQYLIYLFQNQINLNKTKQFVLIRTNKGFKSPIKQDIYLTKTYGNKYNFNELFPSYDWCWIDQIYFESTLDNKKSSQEQLRINWRKFLIELGLKDMFSPDEVESKIAKTDLVKSDYSMHMNKLDLNQDFFIFKDYDCKIFNFYLSLIDALKQQEPNETLINELLNLFKVYEEYWDQSIQSTYKFLSNFKTVSVYTLNGRLICQNLCETKFFIKLKQTTWICVETLKYPGGFNKSKIDVSTRIQLNKPYNTFVKEPIFLNVYLKNADYALYKPNAQKSSLSQELNFKLSFDLSEFLTHFKSWYWENKKFCANLSQMKKIYLKLGNELNSLESENQVIESINSMIHQKQRFIFIPDYIPSDSDEFVLGSFLSSDQVYWSDPSGLFKKYNKTYSDKNPILLESFYDEKLKPIFIEQFNISTKPNLIDYINLLEHISYINCANKNPFNYSESLNDVFLIYEFVVEELNENLIDKSFVIDLFSTKNIVPCFGKKFLSLKEKIVLVGDDLEIAEKFVDNLNFIVVNASDDFTDIKTCSKYENLSEKLKFFYKNVLEIEFLNNLFEIQLNFKNCLIENSKISELFDKFLPFIQSFMFYRTEFKQIYSELVENQIQLKLDNLKFYTFEHLEIIYTLKQDSSVKKTLTSQIYIENKPNWILYVKADFLENQSWILKSFSKLFIQKNQLLEKELLNFLLLMQNYINKPLKASDKIKIEKEYFFKFELPMDIVKWKSKELNTNSVEYLVESPKKLKLTPTNSKTNFKDFEQLSRQQIGLNLDYNFKGCNLNIEKLNHSQILSSQSTPEWSKSVLNELNSIRIGLPNNQMDENGKKYVENIGRWGEIWLNEMLKQKYRNELENNLIQVEWMNENCESGLPYDFRLIYPNKDFYNSTIYIEAKSTIKSNQDSFPISLQELSFAQNFPAQYEIYRLYNVADLDVNNVKYKIIKDVPYLLHTHSINLFIVI